MKQVCVVTGSRAEYGLLKWVIKDIQNSRLLRLQLLVTGSHLNNQHGLTIKEIKNDGFKIDSKVRILAKNDNEIGIASSISQGIRQFVKILSNLKPTFVIILGDRFEIFSAAISCTILKIPIVHLHGGERTEGAIDEALRHSITKMSHIHFVASNEYKKRVIQLGENPKNIFNVGGFGVDSLYRTKLLTKKKLEEELKIKFLKKNLLITFHPVTLESEKENSQAFDNILLALFNLKDTRLIFTMPNADTNNKIITQKIIKFCKKNYNSKYFTSLGHVKYLSCLKFIDGVIGNSSSGLSEVPIFKKGAINIGDRQKGRQSSKNVIQCKSDTKEIILAIKKLYSKSFQKKIKNSVNPYGKRGASTKLVRVLEKLNTSNILKKKFNDIVF